MTIRDGVSYEQVVAAADALIAQGDKATVRAVRAATGGSPNTILKHLRAWRERHPAPAPQPVREMPSVMLRAYHEEMARVAAEARAELEAQLVELQTEATDLGRAADDFERERDLLADSLAEVERERDMLVFREKARLQELEQLRAELERERRAAEEARIEVAQMRLAGEGQRQQLEELRARHELLREEHRREHRERVDAEREQATLRALNEGLGARIEEQRREQLARLEEVQVRESGLLAEVERLRARVEQLVGAERTAAAGLAQAEAALLKAQRDAQSETSKLLEERRQLRGTLRQTREHAEARAAALQGELTEAREALRIAVVETAHLKGRLEEQQKKKEDDAPPED